MHYYENLPILTFFIFVDMLKSFRPFPGSMCATFNYFFPFFSFSSFCSAAMYFVITPIFLSVNILIISFLRIRQDATASLILLWKVTTTGFKQCSLIDGRSVTLLQALGGLVLSEEMLALGNNYFIGE